MRNAEAKAIANRKSQIENLMDILLLKPLKFYRATVENRNLF